MGKKINAEYGVIMTNAGSPFRYYGWPSVAKLDNGDIVAASSGMRLDHVCCFGKTVLSVSKDEGKTWGAPIIVNDTILDDRDAGVINMGNNKVGVTWFTLSNEMQKKCCTWRDDDDFTKKLILAYTEIVTPEEDKEGHGSFVRISNDGGHTWGEQIRVPVTAPHGFIVLKDGSYLYFGKTDDLDKGGESPITAYKSVDGEIWELAGTVPVVPGFHTYQYHEPHVIELKDGRLMGMIRTHEHLPKPREVITYKTISEDGGKTWTVPEEVKEIDGYPPHLLRHSSGAIICSYAYRNGDQPETSCEKAAISYDEGETWSDYVIDDRGHSTDLGYPASVELSNGDILTVYYQSLPNQWKPSILCSTWSLPKE